MLEYLYFSIGGFFEGRKILSVHNQDGCLTLDHYLYAPTYHRETWPHFHAVWEKERSKRWMKEFDALPCEEWQDSYFDDDILDGTQWELRYKYQGMAERRVSGSNAYPDGWEAFQKWVGAAVSALPRLEDADADAIAARLAALMHEPPSDKSGGRRHRQTPRKTARRSLLGFGSAHHQFHIRP